MTEPPLTAWRAWALDEAPVDVEVELPHAHASAWRLVSTNNTTEHSIWEPHKNPRALCLLALVGKTERHEAPHDRCRCGFYGYASLEDCLLAAEPHEAQVEVVGEVRLSGRIIRTGETYRAEFAYPERLIVIDRPWRNVPEKARELAVYGVPVDVRAHPERRKESN